MSELVLYYPYKSGMFRGMFRGRITCLRHGYPYHGISYPHHKIAELEFELEEWRGGTVMALTDMKVKALKPKEKSYKVADEKGLFILVMPNGGKWWRFKYYFEKKEKLLSFGTYPDVSLAQARERRDDARKLVASGVDPSCNRKAVKSARGEVLANSFEVIAREWHEQQKADGAWMADHAATIMNRMEKDMFPWIGSKPITEVTAKDLRTILDRVRSRGVIETARRCRTIAGQVFT